VKLGIGQGAADRRVQGVDPNERHTSGLRTQNFTPSVKPDKLDRHASQKESDNAEYGGGHNREYQVDGSYQYESLMDRSS
jgi:hypothetical protein